MKLRHSRRTANSSPSARSGAPASRRIAGYLDIYDRATASKRTLFETQDLSVLEFTYAPDGASIWFTAAEKGTHNLHVVPVTDGAPRIVAKGGAISAPRAGRGIVVSKSSMTSPADVFALDVGGNGYTRQITRENATLAKEVAWPTPESATVAAPAARPFSTVLAAGVRSLTEASRRLFIHGGPQGAGRCVVVAVESGALGGAGLGDRGAEPARIDRLRTDVCRRNLAGLVREGDGRPRGSVRHRVEGCPGRRPHGHCRRELRRLRRELDHRAFDRFKAAVSHDGVFNLESMALTTEELWFSEWEFGGPAWSETARQNFAKASPHLHVSKIKTSTLVITTSSTSACRSIRPSAVHRAATQRSTSRRSFPDEGHWVLQPLNSKRWHDVVFGWLNKNLGASHGPSQ